MKVTVVDHVKHSAEVTQEQALAYCRRVLVQERGWTGRENRIALGLLVGHTFNSSDRRVVYIPWPASIADVVMLCDDLARVGVVAHPSEALRTMAAVTT